MKTESVLTILMYLFKNHIKCNDETNETTEEDLVIELQSAGFHKPAIDCALDWINNLSDSDLSTKKTTSPWSRRILTHNETTIFNQECQNYFIFLQEEQILTPIGVDLVINQLVELHTAKIDVGLIQWVTLMFLYNQDTRGDALKKMELLVLQEKTDVLQ
jgi:uncharacterized protein Smg (DUF494 family)